MSYQLSSFLKIGNYLSLISKFLLIYYLITFVFDNIPLNVTSISWQIGVSRGLIIYSPLLVLGLILAPLACYCNPRSQKLFKYYSLTRKLALSFTAIFIVILFIQPACYWMLFDNENKKAAANMKRFESQVTDSIKALNTVNSKTLLLQIIEQSDIRLPKTNNYNVLQLKAKIEESLQKETDLRIARANKLRKKQVFDAIISSIRYSIITILVIFSCGTLALKNKELLDLNEISAINKPSISNKSSFKRNKSSSHL